MFHSTPRLLLLAAAALPAASQAGLTVTWTQVGDTFRGDLTGSIVSAELGVLAFENIFINFGVVSSDPQFTTVTGVSFMSGYGYDLADISFGPGNSNFNASTYADPVTAWLTSADSVGLYYFVNEMTPPVMLWLPGDYQLGAPISSRLTTARQGLSLEQAFTFGPVISFNSQPLLTYVNGGVAVPEPSTYGLILGGLALAGAAIRRRKAKQA